MIRSEFSAKAIERIRTTIKAAILIAIAAAAIFWGDAIVADVQGWQALHAEVVEMRLQAAGE